MEDKKNFLGINDANLIFNNIKTLVDSKTVNYSVDDHTLKLNGGLGSVGGSGYSPNVDVKEISLSSQYLSSCNLVVADDGHIVTIFFYINLSKTVPDGTTFATIPSEYVPIVNTYFNMNGDSARAQHCYIDTDGNIKPWQNGGILKDGNLTATVTYIKKETTPSSPQILAQRYSTDEQDTGVLWIDGSSHVYVKTIYNTSTSVADKVIGNIPVNAKIIDMSGCVQLINPNNGEMFVYPITYADGSYFKMIRINPSNGNIQFWVNHAWIGWTDIVCVTIKYIK